MFSYTNVIFHIYCTKRKVNKKCKSISPNFKLESLHLTFQPWEILVNELVGESMGLRRRNYAMWVFLSLTWLVRVRVRVAHRGSQVKKFRSTSPAKRKAAEAFSDWGIPTAE